MAFDNFSFRAIEINGRRFRYKHRVARLYHDIDAQRMRGRGCDYDAFDLA